MTSVTDIVDYSRTLILRSQTSTGAYPACENFSAYRGFCWLRDGSFTADAMSSIGEAESATAFFDWCARAVENNGDVIRRAVALSSARHPLPGEQMLPTRFRFDATRGDDDWWDFQLDGYGTWIWAALNHTRRHPVDPSRWAKALNLTVEYLVSSWNRPCYDWWEEHSEQIHISTLGCIAAGLGEALDSTLLDSDLGERTVRAFGEIMGAIAAQGVRDGHLVKWMGSDRLDGSLSALLAPLGVIDPCSGIGRATICAIDAELVTDGGVYRFLGDTYFGGGRWPLLTCFLGLAKNAAGDREGATTCLDWSVATATASGDLPEQVDGGLLLEPSYKQQWVDKWGPVATPLLWSHGMVVRLAAEFDATKGEQ